MLQNKAPTISSFTAVSCDVFQEFASVNTPVQFGSDVAVTEARGSLFAKKIYHAALRNCRDAQSIEVTKVHLSN